MQLHCESGSLCEHTKGSGHRAGYISVLGEAELLGKAEGVASKPGRKTQRWGEKQGP